MEEWELCNKRIVYLSFFRDTLSTFHINSFTIIRCIYNFKYLRLQIKH